jgi:hypothetical protein
MGQITAGQFEEFAIEIPALPRPTLKELQRHNRWINSIERDTSPEGPVALILRSVLGFGVKLIDGTEYERRLALRQHALLGFQHCQWILNNQMRFPAFMALLGRVYVDFAGIVVCDGIGDRRVPCCLQEKTRWRDSWNCIDAGCSDEARVAFAREQ